MRASERKVVEDVAHRLRAWAEREASLADALQGKQRVVHRNQGQNYLVLATDLELVLASASLRDAGLAGRKTSKRDA